MKTDHQPYRPTVSVVILTKNQAQLLNRTLRVLKSQTQKPDEIIIVDSGSTDQSQKLYQQYQIKVINYPVKQAFNYAKAFNLGTQAASKELVVRLSGDCVPIGKNWLKNLTRHFSNSKTGAVFGKYVFSQQAHLYWRLIFNDWIYGPKQRKLTKLPVLLGGHLATRKSLWQQKPFDEEFDYGEDLDFGFFLLKQGVEIIYDPAVKSWHEHRGFVNALKRIGNDLKCFVKMLKISGPRGYFRYYL